MVAASDPRLSWRAAETFILVAVGMAVIAGPEWELRLFMFALFALMGVGRVLLWRHWLGRRQLVVTPEHLIAVNRGRPERWVAWEDVQGLMVVPADRLPGWFWGSRWLSVHVDPDLKVVPQKSPAFVSGELAEMMISRRDAAAVLARLAAVAEPHGVEVALSP